jgi:hypothetical protein
VFHVKHMQLPARGPIPHAHRAFRVGTCQQPAVTAECQLLYSCLMAWKYDLFLALLQVPELEYIAGTNRQCHAMRRKCKRRYVGCGFDPATGGTGGYFSHDDL